MLTPHKTTSPTISATDTTNAASKATEVTPSSATAADARTKRIQERRAASTAQLLQFLRTAPPPLDFIWPGFLLSTVGAIIAAGSTGKSFYALQAAMCVAHAEANKALLNLDIKKHGRVVIFNAEDPKTILWERIHAIAHHLPPDIYEEMAKDIEIISLFGVLETDLSDSTFRDDVLEICEGARLVIFDTFNRFSGDANENDNAEMAKLLKYYEHIAHASQCAVLFLHHSSKYMSASGRQHEQEAARGASAITSNLRWQGFMQTMSEAECADTDIALEDRKSYVRYGANKENYGHSNSDRWFKRERGGVLLPTSLEIAASNEHKSINSLAQEKARQQAEFDNLCNVNKLQQRHPQKNRSKKSAQEKVVTKRQGKNYGEA
jgi:hypothetical protein